MDIREAILLHQSGRIVEAKAAYEVFLKQAPNDFNLQHLLGMAYSQLGQPLEAIAWIEKALAIQPNYAQAHINLGAALQALNRHDESVRHYERALVLEPEYADAHNSLGTAFAALNRHGEAMRYFERALALDPVFAEAHYNLGLVLLKLHRHEEAIRCCERALGIRPDYAEAHNNLGKALQALNRHEEAIRGFERAFALKPDFVEAYYNLGTVLQMLDRHEEAIRCYEHALSLKPGYAEARNNLGTTLQALDRHEVAMQCFEHALALKTDLVEARHNLGNVLQELNRHAEAIDCYERALAIKPDYLSSQLHYVHLRAQQALWHPEREQDLLARFRGYRNRGEIVPFPFLHFVESAAVQKEIAQLYAGSFLPTDNTPVPLRPLAPGGDHRPRVAYFSSDFHSHAIGHLVAELFELHDAARFDITLFSYGKDDGSAMRKRIAASAGFVDLRGLSLSAAREQIRARQPDILIDLKGYTVGTLSKLLARRMAPVQVNWLGYPGTMGADFIDYIIADPFVIPEGAEDFYSEKIVRLPDCYQPNDRKRPIATPQTRAAYGLPETGLVFCCFNQVAKIRSDIFDIWLEVLDEVKDSVLWLMAGPEAERNLKRIAVERGVDPGRLIVAPNLPLAEHLARYQVADLALDTYPYGSHTTASDALWAGCPIVALVGETFASRVSGSLLHAVGLAELITRDLEGYKRLILRLAQSETYRNEVRARLKRNRDTAPLFDTPRFARNLERAYEAMMERARAGLPAAHIRL